MVDRTAVVTWRRVSRVLRREESFYFLSIALLIAVWEFFGQVFDLNFLPPFTQVARRFATEMADGTVLGFLASSLSNLAIGFTIGASAGVIIGALMGLFRPFEIALEGYVYGLMTAPSIVFIPIYFSIFGLSRWSIVILIVQYVIFIVIINTMTGVKQVSPQLIDMARVFGASQRQQIIRIVLPAALPLTMAGLRIGVARALKGMVNGELLIALIGIGGLIVRYGNAYDAEGVLAIVLLIIVVSLLILKGFALLDQRLTGWLPEGER